MGEAKGERKRDRRSECWVCQKGRADETMQASEGGPESERARERESQRERIPREEKNKNRRTPRIREEGGGDVKRKEKGEGGGMEARPARSTSSPSRPTCR